MYTEHADPTKGANSPMRDQTARVSYQKCCFGVLSLALVLGVLIPTSDPNGLVAGSRHRESLLCGR